MTQYAHIDSIYKRDLHTKKFIDGDYTNSNFEYLEHNKWEFTEKVDGTNIRVMYENGEITFGGKTDNAQIPAHLYTKLADLFLTIQRKQVFKQVFDGDVCLYGEGFGYKIQGKVGIDYLIDTVDFYLFDIKIGEHWLRREDVYGIGEKLGLQTAKVFGYGTLPEAIDIVKQGFPSNFGTAQAEGLVLRPCADLLNRDGSRIITKIKVRDFVA